jgi:hypothetical protein
MTKDKVIYRDPKPIENPRSTIYCPPLYYISRAPMMKSLYTLGCSLTDPSDLSDFLVLVLSYDSKAQCHLLEFRRNMSSHNLNDCGGTNRWLNLGKPAWVTVY